MGWLKGTSHYLHPALLKLGAAYTCGAVISQSMKSCKVGLGERYPITLDFEKIFDQSLDFLEQEIDLDRLDCSGMGATGTWFSNCLELMNVRGEIHGYDDDKVSSGNLQRTTYRQVQVGMKKVNAFKQTFMPTNDYLEFIPHDSRFPEDGANYLCEKVITCVDSRKARRNIQDYMPKYTFDCSTTDISEITLFFGALRKDEACLSCLYHEDDSEGGKLKDIATSLGVSIEDVETERISLGAANKIAKKYQFIIPESIEGTSYDTFIKELCGQGKLLSAEDTGLDENNLAPLCHVSAIAGIVLAIETAKRHFNKDFLSNWNHWKLNPWTSPIIKGRKVLPPNESCSFHRWSMNLALDVWNRTLNKEKKKEIPVQITTMAENVKNYLADK